MSATVANAQTALPITDANTGRRLAILSPAEARAVYAAALEQWQITRDKYKRWQATRAELDTADEAVLDAQIRYLEVLADTNRRRTRVEIAPETSTH